MTVRFSQRDRTWFYRFKLEHRPHFKQGFQTEKEAQNAESLARAGALNGKQPVTADIRQLKFGEASQKFYDEYARYLSSREIYKARLPVICEFFKGRRFVEITREDIRAFRLSVAQRKVRGKRVSEHTVNHYHAAIKAIYNWWINEQDCDILNPAAKVSMADVPKARVRFLYPAEEKLLTPVVEQEYPGLWPYYFTALHTGLRLQNLVDLRVGHIDFTLGQIFVPTSKTKRSAYVPIPDDLRPHLVEWSKNKKADARVLGPYTRFTVSHFFRLAAVKAKVENLKFHDLRHTFAYHLLSRGEPLYKVSKLLMHSSQKVTEEHYGHMATKDLQQTADMTAGIISRGAQLQQKLQQTQVLPQSKHENT